MAYVSSVPAMKSITKAATTTGNYKRIQHEVATKIQSEKAMLNRLKGAIKDFEDASGINILNFEPRQIGEAAKLVLELGDGGVRKKIEAINTMATREWGLCRQS